MSQIEEINKLKSRLNKQEISTVQLKKALTAKELSKEFQDEKENKRKSQEILIKKYKEEISRLVNENHRLLLQYNESNIKLENANANIRNINKSIESIKNQVINFNIKVNTQLTQMISPLIEKMALKLNGLLKEIATTSSKFIDMSNVFRNSMDKKNATEKQKDYTRLIEAFKKEIESVEAENSAKLFELRKMNQVKTQNLKRCIYEYRKLKTKLEKVCEERNKLNKDIEELKATQGINTEFK